MHLACGLGRNDLINILLDSGSECLIDSKSLNGFTCLHYLALSDRDDMMSVQLIISHLKHKFIINQNKENSISKNLEEHLSSFINTQNNDMQTALMLASARNKQSMVKFLLDYNASIAHVDASGLTVLQYARQNSCSVLLNSFVLVSRKKEGLSSSQNSLLVPNQAFRSSLSRLSVNSNPNEFQIKIIEADAESYRPDTPSNDRVVVEMNDT